MTATDQQAVYSERCIHAACPPGTYRGSTDSPTSCISCPANTVTTVPHASICQCSEGFYRTSEETGAIGCSCKNVIYCYYCTILVGEK